MNAFSKISPECIFSKISRRRAFSKIHLIFLTHTGFLHAPGQQEMINNLYFMRSLELTLLEETPKADAMGHSGDWTHKVSPFEIPMSFGVQKFGIPKEVDKGMVLHNNGKRMPIPGPCIRPFAGQQEFLFQQPCLLENSAGMRNVPASIHNATSFSKLLAADNMFFLFFFFGPSKHIFQDRNKAGSRCLL